MSKRKPSSTPVPIEVGFSDEGDFHPRPIAEEDLSSADKVFLSPVFLRFLIRFEKRCTFDCCGVSALQLDPPVEWDRRWNYQFETMKEIQAEIERAQNNKAEVIGVDRLWVLYKDDWLFFLRYLEENMEKTKQWK
jgi:hypothetical protein